MAYFSRQELCHCQCRKRQLTIKRNGTARIREKLSLCQGISCSTLKSVRKSRASSNEPLWLALYARRALPLSDVVNESFDNYQRFYFRKIVGVGRDEIEKHKFKHTPIENGRYKRLITLLAV